MPFRDRFKRLRKGSVGANNSPPDAPSPETASSAGTGEATPAMTKTPTTQSQSDLTTIEQVLTHQASLREAEEGKKKKGLFKWKKDPYKYWPSDVYKPHEVPAPKYKRTPDPKHVENLTSFSFGGGANNFLRRFSLQSDVSPGGSRRGSRRHSRMDSAGPSQNPSRNVSISDEKEDSGIGSPREKRSSGLANHSSRPNTQGRHEPVIGEDEDEDATMSRQRTAELNENEADRAKTTSQDSGSMPFTQQELTQALSRANISPEPNLVQAV